MSRALMWKMTMLFGGSIVFAGGCRESSNTIQGSGSSSGSVVADMKNPAEPVAVEVKPETPPLKPAPSVPVAGASYSGNSHALLIGCTTYDHLSKSSSLRGPINDVSLMREVLLERFGFKEDLIRTLTEESTAHGRPIKENIAIELSRLADVAESGDRVVILLSGHGSQQPDDDFDNLTDPEPDGLDEIFCPADIDRPATEDSPFASNALTDDEMRKTISSIRKKAAFVWVIVDSCHSGSAVRGTEVYRQLSPEDLIGANAIQQAKRRTTVSTRGLSAEESAMDAVPDDGGFVAIYAAQPHEPTLEMKLPEDADDPQWRGLLTYTLIKVLTSAETPLSYRELVQRIRGEYVQTYGRLGPTPLIEGTDQHRQVLEQTELPARSDLVLMEATDGPFSINAGRLHGFSKGTVFAVYPPPGAAESKTPLGYVKATHSQLTSLIVAPADFNNTPATTNLPAGGRVEPVEVQYGELALKIAFDDQFDKATKPEASTGIPELLRQIETDPHQRIKFVDAADHADWVVRRTATGECFLVPCEGWSKIPDETYFGPAPVAEQLEWFQDRLSRIARVKGLLKLCDASEKQSGGLLQALLGGKQPCGIKLELFAASPESGDLETIDWLKRKWKLTDGEKVMLEITNKGSESIDFSVLFIDSKFGITPLFPPPGVVADNRIQPGQSYAVGPMQVEASTVGLEHLLVIATKASGQPLEFSWLGQNSLEAAQRAARAGIGAGQNNPLGELLEETLFSKQNVRGMRMADAEATCLRSISWQTVPQGRVETGSTNE